MKPTWHRDMDLALHLGRKEQDCLSVSSDCAPLQQIALTGMASLAISARDMRFHLELRATCIAFGPYDSVLDSAWLNGWMMSRAQLSDHLGL